jgi:succinate dehydrogenase/fumarate reductase flavoprotein subunit
MTAEKFNNAKWSFDVPPDPVPEDKITQTISSEVIVIGSGVSGLVTAASVLNSGGQCILFSAGTKAVSRGGSNHAIGTKTQQRLGLTDYTPDKVVDHFQNEISRQGYRIDGRKWWIWINKSGEAMDWLTDLMEKAGYVTTLEIPYVDVDGGVFSIPCGAHNFYGPEIENSANNGEPLLTATLEKYIADNGGEIHYATKAEYLIRENGTGRVSGVVASNADGSYVKYEASKGVVLATGDFSGSPDLMARYCSAYQDLVSIEGGDYDAEFQFGGLMPGDGHKMALWAGGAWQHTNPCAPMIGWYGFPAPESDMNHPGILLNKEGQRFMNESSTSVYAGYAIQCQSDNAVYTIFDSNFLGHWPTYNGLGVNMDLLGLQPITAAEKLAEIEAGVESGTWFKGETIDEVLGKLDGLDVESAKKTIERYNGFCDAKHDDDFHKTDQYLLKIEQGPFYGAVNIIGPAQFLSTCGGIRCNEEMAVLDETNQPIEGLYVVGSAVGDSFGTFYNFRVPGQNLGMNCVTQPYLLGQRLGQ